MKMHQRLIGLGLPALACGIGALLGTASAQADSTVSFPCGQVCQNSAVNVTVGDNAKTRTKTTIRNDGTTTTRTTGKGPDLTFYNPDVPTPTYSLKGNGATSKTVVNPDGTSTLTVTGHNVLFYFPTDTMIGGQPGPGTILVTGRAVVNIDAQGNWTTITQNGKTTDICAQLPPSPPAPGAPSAEPAPAAAPAP